MASSLAASLPSLDAFGCLGAIAALAYVPHCLKVAAVVGATGGYGMRLPRDNAERAAAALEKGERPADKQAAHYIRRLQACHQNHLENFPIIAAAVLAAVAAGVPAADIDRAATAVLALRAAHLAAYALGSTNAFAYLRALFWGAGLVPTVLLFSRAAAARMASRA